MSKQETRTKLAPDLSVSKVITGLWQIADMERDDNPLDLDETARHMRAYTNAGLTTFDMADHYGSAEDIAGIFTAKYAEGEDVEILTKWVPEPGSNKKSTVRTAMMRSLERLQAESIDLLQYHAWNYADPSYLDDLYHLRELQEEGLIRHLGLTNFDTAHLNIVVETGIPVVSNQVSFSLLDQRAARDMTTLCKEKGVRILAFGTLAGGFLTERWLGRAEPGDNDLHIGRGPGQEATGDARVVELGLDLDGAVLLDQVEDIGLSLIHI